MEWRMASPRNVIKFLGIIAALAAELLVVNLWIRPGNAVTLAVEAISESFL
jgi:hypothetical protein